MANDEPLSGRLHGSTIELEDLSPYELLEDVQEILTQMITPGMHAQPDKEMSHEQVRTALNLVLRAMSILKRAERRKQSKEAK